MNYEEALDYIHGTYKYGSKLGIHNISCLLNHMGNPQKKLKFVHVAGTNGKGSTVAFISQILIEAGYKVGVFTSPHVQRFTERIKINECEIDGCDLGRVTSFVKEKVNLMLADGECHPTEFEVVTAIAMQYFMESSCDVVVLEVGLGGRLDSTNVIDVPDLAIITTISLDHTDILGETLQEVAFEKAGIIKEGGEVLCYPQPGEVEELFEKVCNQKGAHLRIADFSKIRKSSNDILGQVFDFNRYKELEITLLGEYQQKNAALAVMAAEILSKKGYKISVPHIYSGLKNARWPGRFEVLNQEPVVIIDGAHNREGAEVLRQNITEYFPDKHITIIIGVLGDKDYKSMVETVIPLASRVITITPESPRALAAGQLAEIIRPYCNNVIVSDTINQAVEISLKDASVQDVICAFGSLYYIGRIRELFIK